MKLKINSFINFNTLLVGMCLFYGAIGCHVNSRIPPPAPTTPPKTFAYVASYDVGLLSLMECNVDLITGLFNNCVSFGNPSIGSPYGLSAQSFGNKTFLYISSTSFSNSIVLRCEIDTNTGLPTDFTSCAQLFQIPAQLMGTTFFKAGNGMTYAYFSIYGTTYLYLNPVFKCQVNELNGDFEQCVDAGVSGSMNVYNTTFNSIGNQTFAYINNFDAANSSLQKCLVDSSGSFSNCSFEDLTSIINGGPSPTSSAIAFYTFNDILYAYIAITGSNISEEGIWKCSVNSNGDLNQDCIKLLAGNTLELSTLNSIDIMTINGNNFAYITNFNSTGNILQCSIDINGNFSTSSCVNAAQNGVFPYPYNADFLSVPEMH